MPTPAIIDQVVDGVVSLINTAWAPTPPNAVTATDFLITELESLATMGTQIYVFSMSYADNGLVDRGPEFDQEFSVGIITAEMYTSQGDPPLSFSRGLKALVQEKIYDVLIDPTKVEIAVTVPRTGENSVVWPVRIDDVDSFDVDLLREKKTFWSTMQITFQGYF